MFGVGGQRGPVCTPKRIEHEDALGATVSQDPMTSLNIMENLCMFLISFKEAIRAQEYLSTADNLEPPELEPKKSLKKNHRVVTQLLAFFDILDLGFK